jgi:hypothetical protein
MSADMACGNPGVPLLAGGARSGGAQRVEQSEQPAPAVQIGPDHRPLSEAAAWPDAGTDPERMPDPDPDLGLSPRQVVPRWTGRLLVTLGVLTVPWIAGLAIMLPSRAESAHYAASWAGFDVLLCVLLLRTGWLALRNREHIEVTAAMTSALLVVDAWFDVMSATSTDQFVSALAMAGCVELPLAGFCLWIAGRVEYERRRRSELLVSVVRRLHSSRLRVRAPR